MNGLVKEFDRKKGFGFFAGIFLLAVVFGLLFKFTELPYLYMFLLAINTATFVLCGYDKSVAGSSATRVPEMVLFIWALLGGSAGLLLGMKVFRHKTQKASFQFVIGLIILAQVLALRYGMGSG